MNHPETIEKRLFTCENCGYSVQVYGESYFDHGCQNYIGTFLCKKCQILFEFCLTKIQEWDTPGDFVYNLADETMCLRCGESNSVIWNKDIDGCPKCNVIMASQVDGDIKLK